MPRNTNKQLDQIITALGIKIGEVLKSNDTTKKEIFALCQQVIQHQQVLTARLDQQTLLIDSLIRHKSKQQQADAEVDQIISAAQWNQPEGT